MEHIDTLLKTTPLPHAILCVGSDAAENTNALFHIARTLQGSESHPDISWHKPPLPVDEARDIVRRAAFSPFAGPYALYIIEDVHHISQESATTLLKRIEEPPAKTLFLLSAISEDAVLPTIVSRCAVVRIKSKHLSLQEQSGDGYATYDVFAKGDIAARLALAATMHDLPRKEVATMLETWAACAMRSKPATARLLYDASRAVGANAHIQSALTYVALSLHTS